MKKESKSCHCLYVVIHVREAVHLRGKNNFSPFPFIPTTKFLQISSFSNHTLSREALKKNFTFIPIAILKMLLLIACVSNE